MIIKLYFFLLALLIQTVGFSAPRVVEVLGVTRSGQSMMLGFGSLEGIVAGQKAVFFSSDTIGKSQIMEVANGEAVKVYPDYSLWYLSAIREASQIKQGIKLGMLSEVEANKGLRPLKKDNRLVVLPKTDNDRTYREGEAADFPPSLARGPKDFVVGDTQVTQTEKSRTVDVEDPQFYQWIDGELTEVDGFSDKILFKVKSKYPQKKQSEDVEASMRTMAFDSYVKSATQKSQEDMLDIAVTGRDLPPAGGTFGNYVDTKRRGKEVTADALTRSKRHGPMWSAGMSDDELRRYIIDTGLAGEIRRREEVLNRRLDHELQFRYSQGLFSNATAVGEKEKMVPKALLFGYETYLQRISPLFNRLTFGAFFESGLGYYDNNGLNLRAEEYGARFDLSYFPWRIPTEIKELIPFVSAGVKVGVATCENSNLDRPYMYQVMSMPVLSAGLKYRFHAGDELNDFVPMGFGSLFVISYERRQFTTAEVLKDEGIKESYISNTLSAQIGMSFYF